MKGIPTGMNKALSKWLRKIHRWIAVPTALAIPAAVVIKLVGSQTLVDWWERWDKIPSLLMLAMAITGAYLFLLPYLVRAQRRKPVAAAPPGRPPQIGAE